MEGVMGWSERLGEKIGEHIGDQYYDFKGKVQWANKTQPRGWWVRPLLVTSIILGGIILLQII